MLVLQRYFGQQVFIDVPPGTEWRRIVVCVDLPNDRRSDVKLGIEADRSIQILRSEAKKQYPEGS